MKRINSSYKLIEFLSGGGSGADTVVNVATVEVSFGAVVLIEKLVFGETGRRLGDHFREHLRDVEKDDRTYLNRSLDTLICRIILCNIWQSAASPYIKEAQKAAKL